MKAIVLAGGKNILLRWHILNKSLVKKIKHIRKMKIFRILKKRAY